MKILILYNPTSGCCYHRVYLPFICMRLQDGDQTIFRDYTDIFSDEDFEVDIVYYNRIPPIPLSTLIKLRKKHGFKIVCDIDDSWNLYPHHYLANTWQQDRIPEHTIENIRHADMVICTNGNLWRDILTYNKNCVILPNALPFDVLQFHSTRIPSPETRIIFAGGGSHYHDLKNIHSVFMGLGSDENLKGKYSFNVAGYEDTQIWRDILALFEGNTVHKNRYMPVNEYMNQYIFSDISIAPLESNTFNTRKSNLKIIEAGCKGIPIVCSKGDPYTDENKGVIRCSNDFEWIKALKELIIDRGKREDCGHALHQYVREKYDLKKVNEDRYQVLRNLIKSKKLT